MLNPTNTTSTNPISEIQRLRAMLSEVALAFRSQQELLQMRGMSLPPELLQNLEALEKDLKGLEKSLASEETELAQLRALAATSALINSSLDLNQVLSSAMDEVIKLTGAERGYIVLLEPDTGERRLWIARDPEQDSQGLAFRGSNTVLSDVLTSGQPLLTDNAYKDPRFQDRLTLSQHTLRSVMCAPLIYKDRVTGAVYVDNRLMAGIFNEREKDVLVAFANQVAVAIENARLFARVQANLNAITELKEVMSNVFGSIASGVITADALDTVNTFNRAAAEILGCPPEKAITQPLPAVLPVIHAETTAHVRLENQRQSFESEMDTETGRRVLGLKLSPLKDAENRTQGVAVVVDDLTEIRKREAQLTILRRYLPPAMVDNIEHIAGLALGGERRELTCLYVDVRALSTFPADLRPAQKMELLNEYLSVATECINQTNGVIDKYMGTEVMVLFNTQLNPQEDHALRALDTALLLREAFVKLYEWQHIAPDPHYYRIGIHSGEATTGNVGSLSRRDFTALGDTINLAHRLLENAAPGQIILSENCLEYMRRASGQAPAGVAFHERDPITVKGRQQATAIYEVFRT